MVRCTDRPNMPIAVDLGVKHQTKLNEIIKKVDLQLLLKQMSLYFIDIANQT